MSINKALLEPSHVYLFIIYDYLHARMADLSNYDRDHMDCKAKNIYYLVIYRKLLPTTNLDDIKFMGFSGRNSRKFCFAFASSYTDVSEECGNLEREPSIHLPAVSPLVDSLRQE